MIKINGGMMVLAGMIGIFLILLLAQTSWAQSEGCGNTYTYDWELVFCPSVTNSPSVSPLLFCNAVGYAPSGPTVVPPIYEPGLKEKETDYDYCNPTYDYANITYTVGNVQWDPPLPGTFTSANLPSFSSQAYVNVTSSDTANCPSPGRVNVGSPVTWNVLNTNVTVYVKFNPSALETALDAVEDVTGEADLCKSKQISTNAEAEFEIDETPVCCDNIPGLKIEVSGSLNWNLGSITCNFPYAGIPHIASVNLVLTAEASLDASISGETECGEGQVCGSVGGTFTIGGGLGVNVGDDFINVTLTIQCASTVTGQICCSNTGSLSGSVTACSGVISLKGNISLFDGWEDIGLNIPLSSGVCLPTLNF